MNRELGFLDLFDDMMMIIMAIIIISITGIFVVDALNNDFPERCRAAGGEPYKNLCFAPHSIINIEDD